MARLNSDRRRPGPSLIASDARLGIVDCRLGARADRQEERATRCLTMINEASCLPRRDRRVCAARVGRCGLWRVDMCTRAVFGKTPGPVARTFTVVGRGSVRWSFTAADPATVGSWRSDARPASVGLNGPTLVRRLGRCAPPRSGRVSVLCQVRSGCPRRQRGRRHRSPKTEDSGTRAALRRYTYPSRAEPERAAHSARTNRGHMWVAVLASGDGQSCGGWPCPGPAPTCIDLLDNVGLVRRSPTNPPHLD